MAATKGKKKITATITHDRLSVAGTFTTGESFRFTVGRSGERMTWASADPKRQVAIFSAFCKFRAGESNADRINRIRDTAERAESAAEFVALMN
jgi:hypothetical protein